MIRTISLMIQLGKSQVLVVIGWRDPAKLRPREKMTADAQDLFKRFQTRMSLKPDLKFSLEDLAEFCFKDETAKPDKVMVNDVTNGSGVELLRPDPLSINSIG